MPSLFASTLSLTLALVHASPLVVVVVTTTTAGIGTDPVTGARHHYIRDTLRSISAVPNVSVVVAHVSSLQAWETKSPISYPELRRDNWCKLARNFGDSLGRVLWRSKLVLDCAYALEHALQTTHGDSYMRLEDDTAIVDPQSIHWIYSHPRDYRSISHRNASSYTTMTPASGIVIPRQEMHGLIRFLRRHFDTAPLDWLIGTYITHRINTTPLKFICHPGGLRHIGAISTKPVDFDSITWDACRPIDLPLWETGTAVIFESDLDSVYNFE
jgi:hypothetical protein